MGILSLPNLDSPPVLAKPLPSTPKQHLLTAVLVAAALGLALATDILAWPELNPAVAFVVPVLIGLVRAGSRGLRIIVAATLVGYLFALTVTAPTTFLWILSYAVLTVTCYLGLRFAAQREEILRLNREAAARTARAESRERQMIDLVDTLYHEVRQPLAMAQMHADAAREASARGDRQWSEASMKAVDEALNLTTSMIKNLVESARLEAGQSPAQPIVVDVGAFVAAFLGNQRGTFDVGRIHVEVADDAEAVVDPRHLERSLVNLLSNALKYSPADKPVTVRVERCPREVVLTIVDAGIGIAPEEVPHLFERGYRAPEAAHVADGTGLGLYIVKLLMDANQGRIWVESALGAGSAFHLALPLAPEEALD